jgi:hypothetical protein
MGVQPLIPKKGSDNQRGLYLFRLIRPKNNYNYKDFKALGLPEKTFDAYTIAFSSRGLITTAIAPQR